MPDFSSELARLLESLKRSRADLLEALAGLNDADLPKARRGGWSVAKVLEHIVEAEWHYAQLVASLRGLSPPPAELLNVERIALILDALERSRAALLSAVSGVSEDDFYRLGTFGREEYSVVSVLENADEHGVEHLGQIRRIEAESPAPA